MYLYRIVPDVKEDRQEGVPPPLLALQELDDVLVAVLCRQVQRSLSVPVPRLKLHCDLGDFLFTLAQNSLTSARLPEMQARWRGEEPTLEEIVKDTSEVQLSMKTSGGQSI